MSNLRPFQIFVLGIFGFLAVLAVVLLSSFSNNSSGGNNKYGDEVIIWGTLDQRAFSRVFDSITDNDEEFRVVDYQQIDARNFNDTLVTAIAEGRSPDLILLPSSELVRQRNRLLALSYDTISKKQFRDSYIDGAEIFTFADGIYAIPLLVNPLMMYWNRDLFSSNGLALAPTSWEALVSSVVPALTRRDNARNILQSAVAFGEVSNVRNAKETVLLLALQSGSKMVYEDGNQYRVELNSSINQNGLPPMEAAVQFYTNFSNSNSQLYSWNRSQPLDRNAFVAGDLAVYFGYGSELDEIVAQNPNLNFDIAPVPQGASASVKRTYGEFYGLAIPKSSQNPNGAFAVANKLADPSVGFELGQQLRLAPLARTAIAVGSEDPFTQSIYGAALNSRGWLDPNSNATDEVFKTMIENITSGRNTLNKAVGDGVQKVRLVF